MFPPAEITGRGRVVLQQGFAGFGLYFHGVKFRRLNIPFKLPASCRAVKYARMFAAVSADFGGNQPHHDAARQGFVFRYLCARQ
ncbi:hypothetical protein, partial [Neisseria gonorrhoeae]